MKRYYFEADRVQWEKPTEPDYVFCAPARINVYADSAEEARIIAEGRLRCKYDSSGFILHNIRLVETVDVPVDWSYGYGADRQTGASAHIHDLICNHIIR